MRIYVVIPHYNGKEEYLSELLDSIKCCDDVGVNYIWVDDASTDRLIWHWLKNQVSNLSNHKTVELYENKGVAGAMNAGIASCPDDAVIITMGCDDRIDKNYFHLIKQIMDRGVDFDVLVPHIRIFGEMVGVLAPNSINTSLRKQLFRNHIPAGSAFKKSLWFKLNGFDEGLRGNFEDWDFWLRAQLRGAKFVMLNEVGYEYRVRGDSLSRRVPFFRSRAKLFLRMVNVVSKINR